MTLKKIINIALRSAIAVVLIQTLRFKFSADPLSVYIFEAVGIEPWGRIMTGVAELIAGVLLLIPTLYQFGAFLAAGVMFGAIMTHLLFLGINVQGDGGQLFYMAVVVFVGSLYLAYPLIKSIYKILKK